MPSAFTPPEPLRVVCNSCAAEGYTFDFQHPDRAVECSCCPVDHDHAGLGCRTVTIYGTAHLRVFEVGDLMDAADPMPAPDRNAEVAPLWRCLIRPTRLMYSKLS